MSLHLCRVLFASVLLLGPSRLARPVNAEEAWPQFRGPSGMGHSSTLVLPTEWGETHNVVWKTELPGTGWSSPVIWGDQIWMTTSTTEEVSPEEVKEVGKRKPFPVALAKNLEMYALCVDKNSGELIHKVLLLKEPTPESIHTMNSYASPTAIIEDGRVYCHFGTNGTACIDTKTGELIWKNRELALNHSTGAGSSPVLWDDLIVVHCDGTDVQYIAALRTSDGSLAWKTDRSGELNEIPEFRKAFCTPLIVSVHGADVLVSSAADWVYGYDPRTGEELWKVPYGELGFSTTPRPIVGDGKLFLCTGFMKSRLLAFDYDPKDRRNAPNMIWEFSKQVPTITSPLFVDGNIFFVSEQGGVLTSLDASSGQKNWQKRLGGNYAASPLYANGHVYVFSREGIATVFKADGEFAEVAKNELDGSFLASAAVDGGALILRTDQAVYRIESEN